VVHDETLHPYWSFGHLVAKCNSLERHCSHPGSTSFMPITATLRRLLPARYRRKLRRYIVARDMHHISGPKGLRLSPDEAVVTCVVKNGEFYIKNFIEHYFRLGFRHIFFLDNGSTDRTVSIARSYANVSICMSALPIDGHQGPFKAYLAETSSKGGWCLDADIDEFFDFPFSAQIGLRDFLGYLNETHSTAVITQLLDMFSDRPMNELPREQDGDLAEVYPFYDLAEISRLGYREAPLTARFGAGNLVSASDTVLLFGGIRKRLYGNNCLLTKHSLFVPSAVEAFPHVHFVNHARLADVSCVMRHYKLTSTALEIAEQNKSGFLSISDGYSSFIRFLTEHPTYRMTSPTSARYRSVEDLAGFAFYSNQYREYVQRVCPAPVLAR